MSANKTRYDEIDLLRGLSCLAVVAFHYFYRGQLDHWVTESAHPLVSQISSLGYLGVHLFFMISGFVIFMSAEGATVRAFVASRVARLYPSLWVAAPLTAAIAWWTASQYFQVDLRTLLLNLTLAPHHFQADFVDGAYWSLVVELQFYALIAIVIAAGWLGRIESLLAGWLVLSLINWLRPMHPLELWLDVNWAPFFTAGIVAYRVRSRGQTSQRRALYAASWLLACLYTIKTGQSVGSKWLPLTDMLEHILAVTCFFGIFSAIAFGDWRMQASFWTVWAGRLTYPVYLLHQNIGYMGIEALHEWGVGLIPAGLLMLLVIVALSTLICLYVEVPVGRWLRRTLAESRPALRTA